MMKINQPLIDEYIVECVRAMKEIREIPFSTEVMQSPEWRVAFQFAMFGKGMSMSFHLEEYARIHREAIAVQDACNLAGVVYSFKKAIEILWKHNDIRRIYGEKPNGTDWVNKHPVCKLYADKIAHLSGAGSFEFIHEAYEEVSNYVATCS